MNEQVPIIDLALPEPVVRKSIAAACSRWGFFQLVNHGLSPKMAEQALRASRAFFSQPNRVKQIFSRDLESPWGFYDRELTGNLADRKQIFDFSSAEVVLWPAQPRGFQATLESYAAACHPLGLRVLELACAGGGLPAEILRGACQPAHSSFTRLNYYPLPGNSVDDAGPLGIGRHTDAGALTLLLQDAVPGLQVWKSGGWHNVEPIDGALTVNVGDMLQVWSNDRYRAPPHRVLASRHSERYSIAYFLNPAYECIVEPLLSSRETARYRPISWQEFRKLRALGDYGDYGDYGEEVQISHYRRTGS